MAHYISQMVEVVRQPREN